VTGQKYQSKEAKESAARLKKEAKQREEEELALLFGHMSGGAAKTKAKMEALEEEKRKAKEKEREAAGDANVWIDQDMTGKAIEVVIEYEREKLAFEHRINGTSGTEITPETFAKWKTDREEAKRRENELKVQREMTKKGKKAALSVLSGKDLFAYDSTLFVDDEGAMEEEEGDIDMKNLKGLMEEEEEEEEEEGEEDKDGEEGEKIDDGVYDENGEEIKVNESTTTSTSTSSSSSSSSSSEAPSGRGFRVRNKAKEKEERKKQKQKEKEEIERREKEEREKEKGIEKEIEKLEINEALFTGEEDLDDL